MQSRWESAKEAAENIAIGFCIALVGQYTFVLLFGPADTFVMVAILTVWMTIISFTRTYIIRRRHNAKLSKRWGRQEGGCPDVPQ